MFGVGCGRWQLRRSRDDSGGDGVATVETAAVMVVAMEVAVAARWRRQGGLVGLVGRSFARLTSSFAQLTSSSAQLTMHIVHDMHILRTAHRPFSGWRPT